VCGLVEEEANSGACVTRAEAATRALRSRRGPAAGAECAGLAPSLLGAFSAGGVLADMSGDGEVCWERTAACIGQDLRLAAEFLSEAGADASQSGPVKPTVQLQQGLGEEMRQGSSRWAEWLVQLMKLGSDVPVSSNSTGGLSELPEVVAQSVGLRLLLAAVRAHARSGPCSPFL
jgi:hypothetical protein